MSPVIIFNIQLLLGYVAWLLCLRTYLWPRLKSMDRVEVQRAIATLHSFRFFGLVFILPGVVGNLPASFATFAAYWDLATGVLAMLALLTARIRPLFWLFVAAFNLVGVVDLMLDQRCLAAVIAGEHRAHLRHRGVGFIDDQQKFLREIIQQRVRRLARGFAGGNVEHLHARGAGRH